MDDKRILVVEDEVTGQKLLEKILLKEGMNVEICSNGAEALYHFLRKPDNYPVVLLDLMMPEVSGETFLDVIESLNGRDVLNVCSRIIIDTAVRNFSHLKKLAEYTSVHAVCQKPIDREKLVRYIKQILDNTSQSVESAGSLEPVGTPR